jgi:hypothetical protein
MLCADIKTMCAGIKVLCADFEMICADIKTMCAGIKVSCAGFGMVCADIKTMCAGIKVSCAGFGMVCAVVLWINPFRVLNSERVESPIKKMFAGIKMPRSAKSPTLWMCLAVFDRIAKRRSETFSHIHKVGDFAELRKTNYNSSEPRRGAMIIERNNPIIPKPRRGGIFKSKCINCTTEFFLKTRYEIIPPLQGLFASFMNFL